MKLVFTIFITYFQLCAFLYEVNGQSNYENRKKELIDIALSKLPNNTQFAIALINADSVHFIGVIKHRNTISFIDNRDSIFEIGSITKVFTSALLSKEVMEGRLKLNDPINRMIDIGNLNGSLITFKTLSNHTSGLKRIPGDLIWDIIKHQNNPYQDYSDERLERYFKDKFKLISSPGKQFHYSNLGTCLLAHLIEKECNKEYEVLLQENIFKRFEMLSTTTVQKKIRDRLVLGRNHKGKIVTNWDQNAFKGAGGILSSTQDLSKFINANFKCDSVLLFQLKPTFTINEKLDIGLGWFIIKKNN